jgi:hypothetical protein
MARRPHEAADYKCHKITHLTGQKDADEAKGLLTRLAEQAQTIMAKNKWKVGVLLAESSFPRVPACLASTITALLMADFNNRVYA